MSISHASRSMVNRYDEKDLWTGNIVGEISSVWRAKTVNQNEEFEIFSDSPLPTDALKAIAQVSADLVITSSDVVTLAGDSVYIISSPAAVNQINKYLVDEACTSLTENDLDFWCDSNNKWIAVIGKEKAQKVLTVLKAHKEKIGL